MITLKVLPEKTKKLFEKITDRGFPYPLAGGTALALQIAHRSSIDLDFMVPHPIQETDRILFKKFSENYNVVYSSKHQFDIILEGVKVTLFTYRRKPQGKLITHDKLTILSVYDIAITKAYVIGRRTELKDYVDLYFLFKNNHIDLYELIQGCEKQYGGDFSRKLFLKQLLCVDQCPDIPLHFFDTPVKINELEIYFNILVTQYLKQY